MSNPEEKKKIWSVTDLNSKKKIEFNPIWQEKDEQNVDGLDANIETKKETECAFIEIVVKDTQGNDLTMKFNYLDLYGFIYFIDIVIPVFCQTVKYRVRSIIYCYYLNSGIR